MGDLIKLLTGTPFGNILAWFSATVMAVVCIYQWLEKYRKVRNLYDAMQEETKSNKMAILALQEEKDDMKKRFEDRTKCLDERDKELDGKLDEIAKLVTDLSEYQKNKDMHDLKDRILTKYKAYRTRKNAAGNVIITEHEYETLTGLIDAYLESGGNSFIHDDIIPSISHWDILSESDFNAMLVNRDNVSQE